MRIFPIAHALLQTVLQCHGLRELQPRLGVGLNTAEIITDRRIVASNMLEGLDGQSKSGGVGDTAIGLRHLFKYKRVISHIDNDGHTGKILSRGAQHGGATNIDIFNGLGKSAARLFDGLLKRIQIHNHKINPLNTMGLHHSGINTTTICLASPQQTTMNLRMQGFHPAIHHLRETRVVRDLLNTQAIVV